MLSTVLAGTIVKLRTGETVTILSHIVGIFAGPDLHGNWCFPAQITPVHQRFIRLHEIDTVVSTPERKNLE